VNNRSEKENSEREEELEEARKYLRLLLKYRPRTEAEIEDKLEQKGYGSDVIEEIVAWGRKKDLIDDALFAKYFVNDRLQNKPKGRSGLYKELLDHGVDKGTANNVLDRELSGGQEEELCRKLARKRVAKYKGDDTKAKYRKTLGFLERRGFARGLANSVLKDILFNDDRSE